MNYTNSHFLRALIRKYEFERDEAIANLKVYFENPVGISDHSDFIDTMDKWVNQLSSSEENLRTIINTFAVTPQQSAAPESGAPAQNLSTGDVPVEEPAG
jgi:hypothetical protein